MTLFADAAAYYVGLGYKVLALAEGRKLPAIKGGHGFKDATDDADVIARLAKRFPRANIGIATGAASGITVIDIDPRNGGDATIAKLAAGGLVFPRCPEARTGNGGRHLFFAYHCQVKANKDRLGPGVDVKTDGGYVVAAPSVIAPSEQGSGGDYRWVASPQDVPLPELPYWLVLKVMPEALPHFERSAFTTSTEAARSLEGMARRLAGAAIGERNDVLNWAAYTAGGLIRQGKLGRELVTSRLTQAALAAGLELRAIRATIASGLRGALEGTSRRNRDGHHWPIARRRDTRDPA